MSDRDVRGMFEIVVRTDEEMQMFTESNGTLISGQSEISSQLI